MLINTIDTSYMNGIPIRKSNAEVSQMNYPGNSYITNSSNNRYRICNHLYSMDVFKVQIQ